jgi:hypothetical protein
MVPVPLPPRGRNREARETRETAKKSERYDIHQHITDQIIAAIENGAGEFRLPWHRSVGNIMRPVNIASKNAYRSVNTLTLWATADVKGFISGTGETTSKPIHNEIVFTRQEFGRLIGESKKVYARA